MKKFHCIVYRYKAAFAIAAYSLKALSSLPGKNICMTPIITHLSYTWPGDLESCTRLSATWYFETVLMVPKCPGLAKQREKPEAFTDFKGIIILSSWSGANSRCSYWGFQAHILYVFRGARIHKVHMRQICYPGHMVSLVLVHVFTYDSPNTWHCFTQNSRCSRGMLRVGLHVCSDRYCL